MSPHPRGSSRRAAVACGGFESRNVVDDARLIAVIETGVPVWALDADLVDAGGLGIRVTEANGELGSGEPRGRLRQDSSPLRTRD